MKPCSCSKPSPGMLIQASKDYEIDLSTSFIIGDKTSDIAAGKATGCVTILVETGKAGREEGAIEIEPNYRAKNLEAAAGIVREHLLRESNALK
jgi:histidinol phosphatase-like enzyme